MSGSRGNEIRGEANEPSAHIIAAPTQARRPHEVAPPEGCSSSDEAAEADEHGAD